MASSQLQTFRNYIQELEVLQARLDILRKCKDDAGANFDYYNTVCTDTNGTSQKYHEMHDDLLGFTYFTGGEFEKYLQDIIDLKKGISELPDLTETEQLQSELDKLRSELDMKMREVYDSNPSDEELFLNAGLYSTMAWTVLATSVLYYLFRRI